MEIGIDVGSTGIKVVFVKNTDNLEPGRSNEFHRVIWKSVVPTKSGQSLVVEGLIDQGLLVCNLTRNHIRRICVTGYGRNLIKGADQVVDEISANAAGIHCLTNGRARTLINVGGQDVKVIRLSETGG